MPHHRLYDIRVNACHCQPSAASVTEAVEVHDFLIVVSLGQEIALLPLGIFGGSGSCLVQPSLARGVGTVETDYLSGHIVLLGRLHGIATPVNSLLQRLAADMAASGAAPATVSEEEFLALLTG